MTKSNLGVSTFSEIVFKLLTLLPSKGQRGSLSQMRERLFCSRISAQHILPREIFRFKFLFEDAERKGHRHRGR